MAPADFASNIVQGKTYEYATPAAESAGLELALNQILEASALDPGNDAWYGPGPTRGDPILVRPRLGQQSFKAVVLYAYSRRCAVTGDRIRRVLEAAHIRPIANGGEHRIDNGLLLRSDVHTSCRTIGPSTRATGRGWVSKETAQTLRSRCWLTGGPRVTDTSM